MVSVKAGVSKDESTVNFVTSQIHNASVEYFAPTSFQTGSNRVSKVKVTR